MKVVQVIGKRSRPVPILLTHDMTEAMDILLATRDDCGMLCSSLHCQVQLRIFDSTQFCVGWPPVRS